MLTLGIVIGAFGMLLLIFTIAELQIVREQTEKRRNGIMMTNYNKLGMELIEDLYNNAGARFVLEDGIITGVEFGTKNIRREENINV